MEVAVPFTLQMLVKKVHIVYGGLTAPTALPAGDTFKPAGYYLAETIYKSTKPIITGWSGDPTTGGQVPIAEPDVAIDDEAQSINVDDMTGEEFAQTTATSDPEPF
jgi:hypothetical protein